MIFDEAVKPKHYEGNGEITCMDALESMFYPIKSQISHTASYWWGSDFKYLWRWPLKAGVQDLKKCIQCLEYLIDMYEVKPHE